MKCEKCNWVGSQHELICDEIDLDVNSWKLCPKCKNNLFPSNIFFTSLLLLNTNPSKTVIEIQNKQFTLILDDIGQTGNPRSSMIRSTIVSLERILNFTIKPNALLINGYKKYDHFQYWIDIPTSFVNESHILIKILHILHIQKYKCQSKQINDHVCFGKFIETSPEDYTNFYKKCSFCARFYEWVNQKTNGWRPLPQKSLNEEYKNKSNNKFSKIFDTKTNNKICLCNEITISPNQKCHYHSIDNYTPKTFIL